MIIFDANKEKKLEMMVETKGIQPQNLDFTFRIIIEGIEYGFPCQLVGNKVTVTIPPLYEVVANELKEGKYSAKLEVTGEGKYYINPFKDEIKVKVKPEVEVTLEDNDNTQESIVDSVDLTMSSIIDEDIEKKKSVIEKKDDKEDKNKEVVKENSDKPKKKEKVKSKFAKSLG